MTSFEPADQNQHQSSKHKEYEWPLEVSAVSSWLNHLQNRNSPDSITPDQRAEQQMKSITEHKNRFLDFWNKDSLVLFVGKMGFKLYE